MTIRVLLADDHGAIRAGLKFMLDVDGIEVVGEASNGELAVSQATLLRPDVVLMDIRMPGLDGIEATRRIVGAGLADVLVLTTFDLDEYILEALSAGAVGFLLKSTSAAALIDAVRRVAAGEGVLAPEVTRTLLAAYADGRGHNGVEPAHPVGWSTANERHPGLGDLTVREREVLRCLGRGFSNSAIGAELHISEATTKTHVSRVIGKLGVTSRMQAALIAREAGLG